MTDAVTDVLAAVSESQIAAAEPVLRLAADSPAELVERIEWLASASERLAEHLDRPDGIEGLCRLAVINPTPSRLATARSVVRRGTRWPGRRDVWFSPAPLLGAAGGGVGFLFPGLEADFRARTADVAAYLDALLRVADLDRLRVPGFDHVEEMMAVLRRAGVICRRLPFRAGLHTPMVEPFIASFAGGLSVLPLWPARIPVWSGTTVGRFPNDPELVRTLCVRQLLEPVRFRELVSELHDFGIRAFIQVGAGQLTSLVEDTLAGREHVTLAANVPSRTGLAQLFRLQVGLWMEGWSAASADADPNPGSPSRPRSTGSRSTPSCRARVAP